MNNTQKTTGLEIAIIGMSGRFPGANNIDTFWENLVAGKETISFFSKEEMLEDGVSSELVDREDYVNAKGIIEDVEEFDAGFFGYSALEAKNMDPQMRLFHECSWEALEHSGYNPEVYNKKIGLFAGATPNLFWQNLSMATAHENVGIFGAISLSIKDYLSTRVSYKLNLRGPSFTLFTACSTSLVAIDSACKALLMGDCTMALAGGVSVGMPKKAGYVYQEGYIRSADGHCRTFDEKASGTVFSDGIGVVVLKKLSEAIKDGDTIHGVINGISVNNDGSGKAGYTAPSVEGQVDVIRKTHYFAGVNPENMGYIEAHGTATQLGDPIEFNALSQAFNTTKKQFCYIGALKSNIGHLDCAAGVASIIKTTLALKNKQLPPSLNYEVPNPKLDIENSPFKVVTECTDWEANGKPRLAGVSAFGVGGTNSYAVLSEAPETESSPSDKLWKWIPLSARSEEALDNLKKRYVQYCENTNADISDIAYTAQVGRKCHELGQVYIVRDKEEFIKKLKNENSTVDLSAVPDHIVFMFSGQGSQYVNMAKGLYDTEPVFKEVLDEGLNMARRYCEFDLEDILFNPESEHDINDTQFTQPILFIVEYALARLLMGWGIKPDYMIGHSIGEYVAACISGVFNLNDAIKLVCNRGRLMQSAKHGSMLSVNLAHSDIDDYIEGCHVELAAVNSPNYCVVSGETEAIKKFANKLESKNIFHTILKTSHAFHSYMMDPVLDEYKSCLQSVEFGELTIPFISNLTGKPIEKETALSPEYWVSHLRGAVNFSGGIEYLSDTDCAYIEVGPGNVLTSLSRQNSKIHQSRIINMIRHPKEDMDDPQYLLQKIGQLWQNQIRIDWEVYHTHEKRKRIPLPTYPFEKRKYWIDEDQKAYLGKLQLNLYGEYSIMNTGDDPLKKLSNIEDWFYHPGWKQSPISHSSGATEYPCLLFFQSNDPNIASIQDTYASLAKEVITLQAGNDFTSEGGVVTLNPTDENHFLQLADLLSKHSRVQVVHTWNLEECRQKYDGDDTDHKILHAVNPLLYLARSLASLDKPIQEINIHVLSNDTFDVVNDKVINPLNSIILGATKILGKEYENTSCRLIDLKYEDVKQNKFSASNLLDELAVTGDNIVTYRNGIRWIPSYEALPLKPSEKTEFKADGTYLITGGTGGIGLSFARYIASKYGSNLVLVSRSGIPEKSEIDGGINVATLDRINTIEQLREQGSKVLVLKADSADKPSMQRVIDKTIQTFGKINGVIHAAGISDEGGILQNRDFDVTLKVLKPKVHGTLLLDELLKGQALDFLVLCSSISAVTAPTGEIGYVAGNSFLDSYAHYKNKMAPYRTLSLNWGAWRDVGMAVAAADKLGLDKNTLLKDQITPEDGIQILERALLEKNAQLVISTKDLNAVMKRVGKTGLVLSGDVKKKRNKAVEARPDLGIEYVSPTSDTEIKLADIWKDILGFDKLGIDDNFFDLGATSIDLVQFNNKVKKAFGDAIPVVKMYEYSTVKKLADFMNSKSAPTDAEEPELIAELPAPKANRLKERKKRLS